jgi:hypothetical protein
MTLFKKYGIVAFIGVVVTGAIAIAFAPPTHFIFGLAYQIKRVLALFLGGLYPIVIRLIEFTPLLILVIGVLLTGLLWGIWRVWRMRRYPLLILFTALIGVNIIFFGTIQFLEVGRLTEPITLCEDYYATAQTGFQVIRYPIETRLRDDAQTFILLTTDGGASWRQIFTAYAVNPQIIGCANIEAGFNEDDSWSVVIEERRGDTIENDIIRYITTDGGNTFERQTP